MNRPRDRGYQRAKIAPNLGHEPSLVRPQNHVAQEPREQEPSALGVAAQDAPQISDMR